MASYTTATITRAIRRWFIPAADPWGAAAAEVGKAWSAAERAYREVHNMGPDETLYDDALRFRVTDDAVVIEFEVEA